MKVFVEFDTVEELGEVKALGRSAEVYALGEDKLVKLYYDKVPAEFAESESLNNTETYELGCGTPQCYGKAKAGTRSGIVLEKINGRSLTETALAGGEGIVKAGQELARLQLKFNQISSKKIRRYKETVLTALKTELLASILTEEEINKARDYVNKLPEDNKVLHLDYYTDNVLVTDKGSVVIDWLTSCTGTPAADVAATKYLFREGPMMPGLTKEQEMAVTAARNAVFDEYYKYYLEHSEITEEEVNKYRIPTLILRIYNFNDDGERFNDGLDRKLHEEIAKL